MKRLIKMGLIGAGVVAAGVIVAAGWYAAKALPVGTGYVAKYLCSSTFLSKRDPAVVFQEDIKPVNPLAQVVQWSVDHAGHRVTTRAFGLFTSQAIYREGAGCTLLRGSTEEALRQQTFYRDDSSTIRAMPLPDVPWPDGEAITNPASLGINPVLLEQALDSAFAEPESVNRRLTRAVVIVYDGRLAAERYAPGFSADMPLLGWSMAKSITNALVGILVKDGMLDLESPAAVASWQGPADPRRGITLDQLMRMSSGLVFDEVYAPMHDAVNMLYGSVDFGAFAASKPLASDPDTLWNYSSGTANIIAGLVRISAEKSDKEYYNFLRQRLFEVIGMTSAVMEPDPAGTFVGSSYAFASPRDWARFGLLYLQDGLWKGTRILPEGWVKYTVTPTKKAPRGEYGALFWLNAGASDNPGNRLWPDAPRDAFAAQGFQEQKVIVIPSKKLVLVRFGATSKRDAWDTNAFIASVLKALPE